MFKIRMQGQYGKGGKRLGTVVGDLWRDWGFRDGLMRGYWVSLGFKRSTSQAGFTKVGDMGNMLRWFQKVTVIREIPAYAGFYSGQSYTNT